MKNPQRILALWFISRSLLFGFAAQLLYGSVSELSSSPLAAAAAAAVLSKKKKKSFDKLTPAQQPTANIESY